MATTDILKKTLMAPVWLLQLFSTAKSFEAHPIIGSHLLNKLGLHVARVVIAHGVMGLRMWLLAWRVSPEDRAFYRKNGYLLKSFILTRFIPP